MRRHRIVTIAALMPVAAVDEVIHVPFRHLADDGLAHAPVYPLALAGTITMVQSREDVKGHRAGDRIVGPGAAGLARRTAGIALRVKHTYKGTSHGAPSHPVGRFETGLSKQGYRSHYQAGFYGAKAFISKAKPARDRHRKAFQDEIASTNDLVGQLTTLRSRQVQSDGFLSVVESVVEPATIRPTILSAIPTGLTRLMSM